MPPLSQPLLIPKKTSSVRRSWLLARSAWRVLKLDKELVALPLLSFGVSVILFITFFVIFMIVMLLTKGSLLPAHISSDWNNLYYLALLPIYIILSFVTNFFGGALVYGALQRFDGNDPTVKGSLAAASRKLKPLFLFSTLTGGMSFLFYILEEFLSRLPFGAAIIGRIFAFLGGAAWAVANFFSLPHIMVSETPLGPFEAIKRSVSTVKSVWKESVVASAGISIVGTIVIVLGIALTVPIAIIGANLSLGFVFFASLGVIDAILLFAAVLVLETLGMIVRAAIFHYATTGQPPETFDSALLQASMTPKKARNIFG